MKTSEAMAKIGWDLRFWPRLLRPSYRHSPVAMLPRHSADGPAAQPAGRQPPVSRRRASSSSSGASVFLVVSLRDESSYAPYPPPCGERTENADGRVALEALAAFVLAGSTWRVARERQSVSGKDSRCQGKDSRCQFVISGNDELTPTVFRMQEMTNRHRLSSDTDCLPTDTDCLPHASARSATTLDVSRPVQRSRALRPVGSLHRQGDTSVSKAPMVLLPPPPLR